ncbi:MAG: mechanosensitive ion channel domain-containing protein, partial [Pseudomonadota bacterium]
MKGIKLQPLQRVILALVIAVSLIAAPAAAQNPLVQQQLESGETPAPTLPEQLTPGQIDSLLARMTDSEIRQLLAQELRLRAEEGITEEMSGQEALDYVGMRLGEMYGAISERVPRWVRGVINIDQRRDAIAARIALGSDGPWGIARSALLLVAAGILAALLVHRMTQSWRQWLINTDGRNYWDKVIRSIVLGLVEILPIVIFVFATQTVLPLLSAPLGPLRDYFSWIYTAGISYCWGAVVVARRAFSPSLPQLRIAPVDDDLARYLYRVIRRAAILGAGAWLLAGTFLHLGLDWGPALLTVATGGTLVAAVLLIAVLSSADRIRAATGAVFGPRPNGTMSRIVIAMAPWALAGYVVVAYGFWLAHFLESGEQHLYGPVGTLIVYLTLPILDRLGRELIRSLMWGRTPMLLRFQRVFFRGWRVVISFAALIVIADLWGMNIATVMRSDLTPEWVGVAIDVMVTLFITWLIWELIKAALHSDRKFVAAGEDVDPANAPQATRLDTLMPMFRGVLLAFVATIGAMFVLASAGVDIGPLLASAGIIGVAIGFGAQALVRDIFSGMFFLIDDAFRVGEYIELSEELRGDVESISIRSLQLR